MFSAKPNGRQIMAMGVALWQAPVLTEVVKPNGRKIIAMGVYQGFSLGEPLGYGVMRHLFVF